MVILGTFALLIFLFGLVSRRVERSVITAPMVFTGVGILMAWALPAPNIEAEAAGGIVLSLAEVALVLVLFTDASRIGLGFLGRNRDLPARLLGIGLPLIILMGALVAAVVFPQLSFWEAAILAAILAPTDAGLGEVVVSSPRVPVRIRQALNVEAGLNDGGAVPFLMLFIALAGADASGPGRILLSFAVEQIGFGALVGLLIGLGGGWLLGLARRRGWATETFEQLALVTLPILCLVAAEPIGGSPFIAAFTAGLIVRRGFKGAGERLVEFSEEEGQLLDLFVFFLFGLMLGPVLGQFSLAAVLYAILSLTLIRMLPVAISLIGTRMSGASVLFMGWFGPRGLASIVLGLVFLEKEAHLPGESAIKLAVMATVLFSILAHGFSASPGIDLYARQIERLSADAPELAQAAEVPV